MPLVQQGFQTIEVFIAKAQSVLQRRKSRAGRSLELHAKYIFLEEQLQEGRDFSAQPESEANKKPDFLFPSQAAYKDPSFPDERLRMLAVKTTCKDRWRQIVSEADRVGRKHLLTLQEGLSLNQFREMRDANVQLVVPAGLIKKYHKDIRNQLVTLEAFIAEVRALGQGG